MNDHIRAGLEYFHIKGWPAKFNEESGLIRLNYKLEGIGSWNLYVRADENRRQVMVYSVIPDKVDEQKRSTVTEFLTRANFGLNIGNFEMDWEDGEVRYRTSIALGNEDMDYSVVDNLVMGNLIVMEDYYEGLMRVISGKISPSDAVKAIRKEMDDIDFDFRQ